MLDILHTAAHGWRGGRFFLAALLSLAVSANAAASSVTVLWDEADTSQFGELPSDLTGFQHVGPVNPGSNRVIGESGLSFYYTADIDAFQITVPVGLEVSSIKLTGNFQTKIRFFNVSSTGEFTKQRDDFVGFTLAPGDDPWEIDLMDAINLGSLGLAPMGPGEYRFAINYGGPSSAPSHRNNVLEYEFDFVVDELVVVPTPAALPMAVVAGLLVVGLRRVSMFRRRVPAETC